MSSKRSRQSSRYPTSWTPWEWNEQHQRDVRARELSKGEWEYQYRKPQSGAEPQESYAQKPYVEEPYTQEELYSHALEPTLEPTPWTPRGRSADPPGALPSIDEQYDDQSSDLNYNLVSGLANVSIVDSSRSEHHQSHDKRSKGRKGERNYDKRSETSDDRVDYNTSRPNEDPPLVAYGSSPHQTTLGHGLKFSAPEVDTAASYNSGYQGSQLMGTQFHSGRGQYGAQPGSYTGSEYGRAPADGSSSSPYVPPPQARNFPSIRSIHTRVTRDPGRSRDKLDPRYKIRNSKEFEFGRASNMDITFVFKVLWSEPFGSGGTEITALSAAKHGEKAFHKVRRFIVMRNKKGHSICIPILTYGHQGVLKYGVHPEDHAVVYSSKTEGPYYHEGEKELLTKKPIRLDIKDPSEKLDPQSRLNYAKTYTVEHNVKVFFIGWIARNYEHEVATCFNDTNPPVQPSSKGHWAEQPDETLFSHTQGQQPTYPTSMPMPTGPTAPTAWGTTGDTHTYASSHPTTIYSPPVNQPYGLSYNANPQMPPAGQQDYTHQDQFHQPNEPTYDDGYDGD
ncbi:hypothetical protein N431DRAFT_384049 [Stipitochalara longipes BDJ]|nr:hypothetical protein N431DRAFT_384049 [Stipitochalara longipes BDJ]